MSVCLSIFMWPLKCRPPINLLVISPVPEPCNGGEGGGVTLVMDDLLLQSLQERLPKYLYLAVIVYIGGIDQANPVLIFMILKHYVSNISRNFLKYSL